MARRARATTFIKTCSTAARGAPGPEDGHGAVRGGQQTPRAFFIYKT